MRARAGQVLVTVGQPDVPIELRRLWGLSVASRLGRPAQLDVERVVRAAVEIADRDGLDAVTLPKIAADLGFTTMSLYRYVGSKDELLRLMGDAAIGVPPQINTAARAWRAGLRRWACAERQLHHRRPWLARLPITEPPAGPNQIAWMEAALRVLRATRLDWPERLGVLALLSGYVRHQSLLSQDLARGRERSGLRQEEVERRYGTSLRALVDPERFPETARLFASGVFLSPGGRVGDDPTADPDFTFGLDRILDGVAAVVARTRRPR